LKVFLRDQRRRLPDHLPAFRRLPLSYASVAALRAKRTSVPVPLAAGVPPLDTLAWDFLFAYDIFPDRILTFAADWQAEGRPLQSGDVIVQQAYLPPWPLSVKCVFGVRVVDVFRGPDRVGFRYGTLQGHAEMGESTFFFERTARGLAAVIETQSVPGHLASRLAGPFFTYPYQQYCATQAVRRMRDTFLSANAARLASGFGSPS
jgi:hypothetical protein